VDGCVFDRLDLDRLIGADRRTLLVDFDGDLTEADHRYLRSGEVQGLHERFLLASRSPWYRMEARPASPIWAAVFGRRGLRFVLNSSGAYNLTTFHCIYPRSPRRDLAAALTACLNSRLVQQRSRAQHRVYGGGLLKFEPRDLLQIQVPDLTNVADQTLQVLSAALKCLDDALRLDDDAKVDATLNGLDELVRAAALEAAGRDRLNRDSHVLNQSSFPLAPT
jgi:adenine-specific DNA-methyltransferase